MKITLFQSDAESSMYAYTSDERGANLPNEFAPWNRVRILNVTGCLPPQGKQKEIWAAVLQTLKRDGFSCLCTRSASVRLGLKAATVH